METAVKPKNAKLRRLSGNIPNTTSLERELLDISTPAATRPISRTGSAKTHSRSKSSTGVVARAASTGAVARAASNREQMPGKKAATSLAPLAGPATNGPTAPPEDNVESLYPQDQLNEIMRNAQIPNAYKVKHPITTTPHANGLNMPPPYTEMAEPAIPSAPFHTSDTSPVVLPAYNSIPHQSASNLANKWRAKLMAKVNPESIRSHNTKINDANLAKISEIISMFGANEHVYKLFAKQVYKIYSNALGTHLKLYELNKYIERYLEVFKTLLLKFGENFTAVPDVMDSLPTIRYINQNIIESIITHINEGRIGLEGVGYLIGKQDKISGLDAVMKYFAKIIATYKPNITQDQIVYFALYLNESINPELYFGLWNDFYDYTQDISVYNDFITTVNKTVNSLELKGKNTEIEIEIFVTRLLELLTDYVPPLAKPAERAGIKKVLLNYFIKTIDKTKKIPDEAYFTTPKKQKEILTAIGYSQLLKGGARCANTTIKKQHTHRKKHTRKL